MAAPKNNLYALGNNGGRPPHYETPEALEEKAIAYFDLCLIEKSKPTITGIALYLGFNSLSSMFDYSKREEFSAIIRRIRLVVANGYEQGLDTFKYGGAIFALTNIDKDNWKNAKSTDITTGGEKLNSSSIDLSKLSDDTLAAIERDIAQSSKS